MANQRIALGINLRQNKNDKTSAFGKYYPEVDVQKTLSLRGFAQHMTDHGSMFGREVVEAVLIKITQCLPELLAQGVPVQLGSLGTFYPTAEVKKNAGVASIAAMEGLNPNDIVQAIHIRFLPDSTKLDNLCGPAFKDACELELRNIVDTQELVVNGKSRMVRTLKPIETAVAELKANGGGASGGDGGNGNGGSNEGTGSNTSGNDSNTGGNSGGTTPITPVDNGGNTGGDNGGDGGDNGDEPTED
jgi:hypothetical protein